MKYLQKNSLLQRGVCAVRVVKDGGFFLLLSAANALRPPAIPPGEPERVIICQMQPCSLGLGGRGGESVCLFPLCE